MLKKDAIKPLYRQMMDLLLTQIQNGTYQEGDQIPTEPELAARYHVSRITVRRTIEELCAQGYLNKKQGKGTFVCHPKIQRKLEVQKNMSFSDTCLANGRIPSSHVISSGITTPDAVCADFLRLEKDESVFLTRRILSADHIPITYDTIYFNPANYPSSQMADALHIPTGEPLMVLESFLKNTDGNPILFVREFIVGSRYQLSI